MKTRCDGLAAKGLLYVCGKKKLSKMLICLWTSYQDLVVYENKLVIGQ